MHFPYHRKARNTDDSIVVALNALIKTCKDGEADFRNCSGKASNSYLRLLFQDRAERCAHSARQLQSLVVELGGDPATGSSTAGALHRRWVNLRAAFHGLDDEAMLSDCERGEDLALDAFRHALDAALPLRVRHVVNTQYGGTQQDYELIKNLRVKFGIYH